MAIVEDRDVAVAKALAAPTRSAILDLLRERGAMAAKEVAETVGVHPNVARGHLDLLVQAGLASFGWQRHAAGGRPSKLYEAAPGRSGEGGSLVADLLATLIEEQTPNFTLARPLAMKTGSRLGRRFRQKEGPLNFEEQVHALLRALGAVSGAIRVLDRGDDWVEVEDRDCPFRSIATAHPDLACSLDKALKEGVMEALGADAIVEVVTSIAWGDDTCREVVRLRRKEQTG
ncbi:MAG: helix-turn-helix transcriptional regulator [Actinomycetota bacterium]|nr:helix-turn-helix domain-containing protein [Actinomycetota bacterium]